MSGHQSGQSGDESVFIIR